MFRRLRSLISQSKQFLASPSTLPGVPPDSESTPKSPATPLDRYREMIDHFDEDREGLGARVVRKVFMIAAYVFPFLVAYAIGKEIGDFYGGPLDLADGWSLGTHTVAWAGEAALAMMVLSTATAFRRYKTDSSYTPKLIASIVSFIVFTLASSFAQWWIATAHIKPTSVADYAALIFRVGMVPCVDVAALLYLSIMGYKSLRQYLGEMEQKAQAIRLLNEAEIAIEDAQAGAKQRREQAIQYQAGQAALQELVLEIGKIQGRVMVEMAKSALTQTPRLEIVAPEGGKEAQNGASPFHNSHKSATTSISNGATQDDEE